MWWSVARVCVCVRCFGIFCVARTMDATLCRYGCSWARNCHASWIRSWPQVVAHVLFPRRPLVLLARGSLRAFFCPSVVGSAFVLSLTPAWSCTLSSCYGRGSCVIKVQYRCGSFLGRKSSSEDTVSLGPVAISLVVNPDCPNPGLQSCFPKLPPFSLDDTTSTSDCILPIRGSRRRRFALGDAYQTKRRRVLDIVSFEVGTFARIRSRVVEEEPDICRNNDGLVCCRDTEDWR